MSQAWKQAAGIRKETRTFAEKLKKRMTTAELKLLPLVQPLGFETQVPLGPWIADFYHRATGIAIEVDGGIHETAHRQCRDEEKERDLGLARIIVLRFTNEDVFYRTNGVLRLVTDTVDFGKTRNFVDSNAKVVLLRHHMIRKKLSKGVRDAVEKKLEKHGGVLPKSGRPTWSELRGHERRADRLEAEVAFLRDVIVGRYLTFGRYVF